MAVAPLPALLLYNELLPKAEFSSPVVLEYNEWYPKAEFSSPLVFKYNVWTPKTELELPDVLFRKTALPTAVLLFPVLFAGVVEPLKAWYPTATLLFSKGDEVLFA